MNVIKLSVYGSILTGREYGKNAATQIMSSHAPPFTVDFTGVSALGSSFGDEIFKVLIQHSKDPIKIQSANPVVQACLNLIEQDFNLKLEYI